ncbi:hypothetical protein MJD09_05860 [bacterium]|nr:hypothetical protein [bacterium]
MKTVLFVCSGNIFRSVTAQLALAKEIASQGQEDDFRSESAGTNTVNAVMRSDLLKAWKNYGLAIKNHTPRQVSRRIIKNASTVITMGLDHQEFIWRQFSHRAELFNYVSYGKNEPILDLCEAIEDYELNPVAARKYIEDTVNNIVAATPLLFRKLSEIME